MFDSIRSSKRVVQIILALIILPFAFWGVESYVGFIGGGTDVAKVGSTKIGAVDFSRTLREQQDRLRAALGKEFSPAMLDRPEARRAVLETMINQRLLLLQAFDSHLRVSDEELRAYIASIPQLQADGQFSRARYEELLRAQGMTEAGFEQSLRQDLLVQQILAALAEGGFATRSEVARWLALEAETREVSEALFKPERFASRVEPTEEALRKYYEANRKSFETPEEVRAEYVVLSAASVAAQVNVPEEEAKAWYDGQKDRYTQPEQRRASHILIAAAKDAPAAEIEKARAAAEEILKQVRARPDAFASLARSRSQDQGSAASGGDLGFFARGAMVKPFEDAVFSLKEGETSGLVQSDFGFHIIRLTGIQGGGGKKFEEVREDILRELRQQAAGRQMAQLAENFSNIVYEQADSLKPAAEKFKLEIRQSDWVVRGAPPAAGELANPRLVESLFSEDSITNRRNTEAVEVAPNTLVSARVLEHRPAGLRPFESVRAELERRYVQEEAAKLATNEGAAALARLAKGENVALDWQPARAVQRLPDASISQEGVRAVFRVAAKRMPAYAGGALPGGGYAIYKVLAARPGEAPEPAKVEALRKNIARATAEADVAAYLATLRDRYTVEINQSALEAKER
ncbi:MAG TPA: peptidylprolyl isomerase [Rhodocyclaceae bacterium]|nr:MAG: peptidylprolyl isomerase [Betaproteobacteria bacterium CG2_30_68_42]PIX75891.1 MAG: peptidylprolyl isomerase [Rhodocyclales bacterium CG_4_10_14_3_um_filter_68_10]PJA58620.1 MAG: peptidylprolyl isomerase [Rhodocyclales bacterium CG_4_9_14_3_um_filter_68_10]HCX32157.1 peptidylprolyl isomerase [Rhodocyclaceae bacterium]